jgi:maltose-binding protein MalE
MMSMTRDKLQWKAVGLIGICLLLVSCESIGSVPTVTATVQATSTSSPVPTPTKIIATPEPTSTELPVVQGEVSIWLDWKPKELEILNSHLEAFQDSFPGIQISVSYYPTEELLDRYVAAVLEGQEPTVLIGPVDWSAQLIKEGAVRDVHGRITEDFLDTFNPVALDGIAFAQSIYGLPISMDGILLYRNRSLASASPDLLSDLVGVAQALDGQDLIGIQLDLGFLQTGAFLQSCNGELMNLEGELSLTYKAGECWLNILQQFRQAGPVTLNTDEDLLKFEAGQAAWLVDGSWNSSRIVEALGKDNVSIDPWPVYSPTGNVLYGYARSRDIFFSTTAEEQDFDAAWILARYLLTPEVQEDFASATSGQNVPVLKSLPTTERWLQELMVAIAMDVPLPRFPEFNIFVEHLETAAVDVARREYNPYYVIRWEYLNIEKALRFISNGEN